MPLLRMKAEGFIEDSMPAMASTLLTAQCVVVWSHPWKKYISVNSLLPGEPHWNVPPSWEALERLLLDCACDHLLAAIVAAGKLLRDVPPPPPTVDYTHASGNHPCPCRQPAARNIARILAAFRCLENDTQPRNLLSIILGLPSFVS